MEFLIQTNKTGLQNSDAITRLKDTYGMVGLNAMLRDYLRNMDMDNFSQLID